MQSVPDNMPINCDASSLLQDGDLSAEWHLSWVPYPCAHRCWLSESDWRVELTAARGLIRTEDVSWLHRYRPITSPRWDPLSSNDFTDVDPAWILNRVLICMFGFFPQPFLPCHLWTHYCVHEQVYLRIQLHYMGHLVPAKAHKPLVVLRTVSSHHHIRLKVWLPLHLIRCGGRSPFGIVGRRVTLWPHMIPGRGRMKGTLKLFSNLQSASADQES